MLSDIFVAFSRVNVRIDVVSLGGISMYLNLGSSFDL
jgi:hypothetical protein